MEVAESLGMVSEGMVEAAADVDANAMGQGVQGGSYRSLGSVGVGTDNIRSQGKFTSICPPGISGVEEVIQVLGRVDAGEAFPGTGGGSMN